MSPPVELNAEKSYIRGLMMSRASVSTPAGDGSGAVITGKLNLIDLAGNEDNQRTCSDGIHLQQSTKINQSLFASPNVIYTLINNTIRVPFRESKLTRILQDSVGGTSQALMVASLNPGEHQEFIHTVFLAARSRQISNSISSAQKQGTSSIKVNMEAKLRAWLESKVKTESEQRTVAFVSSLTSKAPSSLSPLKKHCPSKSSTKAKAITNLAASNGKER